MENIEKTRYEKILKIIHEFESNPDKFDRLSVVSHINQFAQSPISEDDLEYYIEGMSLEEFVLGISIEPILGSQMSEQLALKIIDEIFENDDPDHLNYRMIKYVPAIEFYFKKPAGYISNHIFYHNTPKADLIQHLRSDKDGPICL